MGVAGTTEEPGTELAISDQTGPDRLATLPDEEAAAAIERLAGFAPAAGLPWAHPLVEYPRGLDGQGFRRLSGLDLDPRELPSGALTAASVREALAARGLAACTFPWAAPSGRMQLAYVDPVARVGYAFPEASGRDEAALWSRLLEGSFARSGYQEVLVALARAESGADLDLGADDFGPAWRWAWEHRGLLREESRRTAFVVFGAGTVGGQSAETLGRMFPESALFLVDGGVFEPDNLGHQLVSLPHVWRSKVHVVASRLLGSRPFCPPGEGPFGSFFASSRHLDAEVFAEVREALRRLKRAEPARTRIVVVDGIDASARQPLVVKSRLEREWLPTLAEEFENVWTLRPLDLGAVAVSMLVHKERREGPARPVFDAPDELQQGKLVLLDALRRFFTPSNLTPELMTYLGPVLDEGHAIRSPWQNQLDTFLAASLVTLATLRIMGTADDVARVPDRMDLDLVGHAWPRVSGGLWEALRARGQALEGATRRREVR